jgi:hypothetical protein
MQELTPADLLLDIGVWCMCVVALRTSGCVDFFRAVGASLVQGANLVCMLPTAALLVLLLRGCFGYVLSSRCISIKYNDVCIRADIGCVGAASTAVASG